jgi:hypothetical protein
MMEYVVEAERSLEERWGNNEGKIGIYRDRAREGGARMRSGERGEAKDESAIRVPGAR